jgi:fermentation-respiration switch protein FrsA (DUF1100 family)
MTWLRFGDAMEKTVPKAAQNWWVRKLLWPAARIIVMVYVGAVVMGFLFQNRLIYFPSRTIEQTPGDIGLEFEEVSLTAADGVKLAAWYVPAAQKDARTLVFCHGNAGNISHRLDKLAIFHGLGASVLIFDYRGYGASSGKPDEKGTYLDAAAAYGWAIGVKEVLPKDVIAYGESLGGSIAAHLASGNECGGLILDSAFTSAADVGKWHYPWLPVRWMMGSKYDTTAAMGKVGCPVLVIHSRDDEIVPFDMGQELFRMAKEPKKFVEISGGHNEGFVESEEAYTRGLSNWLAGPDGVQVPQD